MLRKAVGFFLGVLMLVPTLSANAAQYRPATAELMSRPYPIVIGNQFNSKNINSTNIQLIAKDLDAVIINKASDLFVDSGPNVDFANQIRALNPKVKVLQYLNLIDVWDFQQTYQWMKANNTFLIDDNGVAVHPYQSNYGTRRWAGDSTNPLWQDYYASRSASITAQGMDGIFSDNWFRSNAQNWALNSTRFSSVMKGWETIGQKSKALMGADKIFIGNGPALNLYQARDGAMIEMRNAPTASAFSSYLKMSDEAASYGQINLDAIQAAWDNSTYVKNYDSVLNFSLPACLLTDNMFAITNNANLFSLVGKAGKVGYPKAPRYRADSVLQRDFTDGKVVFNDTASTVTVNLPFGVYKNLDGAQINSVTLDSFRGAILKVSPIPAPPTNLNMTGVTRGANTGSYYVNLSWTDNAVNETGYEVYQSINSPDNFQLLTTLPAATNTVSLNLGNTPAEGTYYYMIVAVNNNGKSQPTNIVNAAVKPVPAAPTGLTTTSIQKPDDSNNYSINLNWADISTNETGYRIYQSVGTQENFQPVANVNAGITSLKLDLSSNPTVGTNYYKITAINANGESFASNVTSANITLVPVNPTNLTMTGVAKGANSGNYYVNLTWSDNATDETAYEIYQSFNSTGSFQLVTSMPANSSSVSVNLGTSPAAGAYYYKIQAVNAVGKSGLSDQVSANVNPTPADPTGLNVSGPARDQASGNYLVNLAWNDNAVNETGYEIYKSSGTPDNFQLLTTVNSNITGFVDNIGANPPVAANYYKVIAVNAGGKSQYSNTASVNVNPVPAAPSDFALKSLTIGATSGSYYVNLIWKDNSDNEANFQILQSYGTPDNFKAVKTAAVNAQGYGINIGKNPTPGTYYYKILAVNEYGTSESNIIPVVIQPKVEPVPASATNLSTTGVSRDSASGNYMMNLNWNDNATNETGYEIYRSIGSPDNFQLVTVAAANSTGFTDNFGTAPAVAAYYYQVVAVNPTGKAQPSNTASVNVNPVPTAPVLSLTSVTKGATSGSYYINLNWKDNSDNETGFQLQQSFGSPDNFKTIKTPAANSQSYGINIGANPTPGTYYYKILAVNEYGAAESNIISTPIRQ